MDDYERRQVESMKQQLRAYRNGRVDLCGLISNFESLYGCLPNMPAPWRAEFREHWGTLEVVYSVAIDNEEPVSSDESTEAIAPALAALERLIEEALA
jgi:hypothetical protein